jgi:hypothetical protein
MKLAGSSCLRRLAVIFFLFVLALSTQPASAQIITIDVPGAVYTVPVAINRAGVVSG